MSAAAADPLAGGLHGARHVLPVRIYYEDTDFSGVVYHASYLRFLERGRTEFLRALGVSQSRLHGGELPLGFAVRRLAIDFLKPARMDDVVAVETMVASLGGASLDISQSLRRGDALLVAAQVKVVCLAAGRPARLPPGLRAALARLGATTARDRQ